MLNIPIKLAVNVHCETNAESSISMALNVLSHSLAKFKIYKRNENT